MTDLHVPKGATWAHLRAGLRHILLERPDAAVVVTTSGSSGTPKHVRLGGAALRASGEASAAVLGGHGRWLLALPTHHVAGLQVLARSVLAGTSPVALAAGAAFTPAAFAEAVAQLVGEEPVGQGPESGPGSGAAPRRYASLVPTQLHRLLADETGSGAARHLDAILLGGAAADPGLLARAQDAGVRVVTTYGMSETCGGCVYDGRPLPGLRVRLEDGRVLLAGPVLADGYVDAHGTPDRALTGERFVELDGTRWFRTDDRGTLDPDGRLRILGRTDEVVVTGGHKVEPREVEAALRALPEIDDAVVVGLPDPEWGQVVGALVVRSGPGRPAGDDAAAPPRQARSTSGAVRDRLRRALPPHALPRRVVVVDCIPLLPSGKPDRRRAQTLLAREDPAVG